MPKLSVIVPVYKAENYLHKCVDSILNQTFTDLELILVDDGSPDNCGRICDEYAQKDARVRVIHKENGGVSEARNIAIEAAQGDIIGFVDSDDEIDLNMYEDMINYLIAHNLDVVCCDVYVVRNVRKTFRPRYPKNMIFSHEEAINNILNGTLDNAAWNKIYKRSVIGNIRYPKGRIYEDVATTYKYIANADKVGYLCQPLYYYFKRKGSIINLAFNSKARYDCFLGYKERLNFVTDNGLSCEEESRGLAVSTALSALTVFYANKENTSSERYRNVCGFISKNRSVNSRYLKNKQRILLWSFSNCTALHKAYSKLSAWSKKLF